MNFVLHVWRQSGPGERGGLVTYEIGDISEHTSFLELIDILNEQLTARGEEPVAFDSDCREGICGMCSVVINGQPHGPLPGTTTCQLYMRPFPDGSTITIEPWRAGAFPIVRDLIVDRSSFDRIMHAGGYVTVHSGPKPDPNAMPIEPEVAELALDAATCIGCGACVAACPNSAAQLFTSAKVQHLNLLPQGQAERWSRTENMVETMEDYFGSCTNHGECHEACPKEISLDFIAFMNRDYVQAKVKNRNLAGQHG